MKLDNKGFTLIELLVVISLIGLLSSIVLASLVSARDKAHLAAGRQFNASLSALNLDSVALLPMDEGTGFQAKDQSGNSNNAVLINTPAVTWSTNTQNSVGSSLSMNGTGFAMVTPVKDSIIDDKVTIAAWIYPTNAGGSYQGVVGDHTAQGYFMFIGNNQLYCDLTTPGPLRTFAGAGTIESNKWQHVACAYDGSSLRWIINGTEVKRVALSGTVNRSATTELIGWSGYSTEYFQGNIDDVKVYAAAP